MSKRLDFTKKRESLSISTAKRVIEWYEQPSRDIAVTGNLVSQKVLEAVFHVRGGVNLPLNLKRQLESSEFPRIQGLMISKWSDKKNSLTLEDAEAFFLDFAEQTDHDFLFSHEVSAGITRASRLFPASDYVTAYHAQRTPWTLHLTMQGAADYVADTTIRSSPNELLLIAPNASLHYKRSETISKWKHYWVIFQPKSDWLELMDWQMITYGIYRLALPEKSDLETIRQLFADMVGLYAAPSVMMQRLLENLLEQVLIRAKNTAMSQGAQRTDPRVLKACKFIEDHVANTLSVGDVADHCNVSESRIAHLFKASLGQSVKSFQDAVRIQRAQRLLATTKEPIAVVGTRVGYDDPAQFSKFFMRKLNTTPRNFRKTFGEPSA